MLTLLLALLFFRSAGRRTLVLRCDSCRRKESESLVDVSLFDTEGANRDTVDFAVCGDSFHYVANIRHCS